VCRELQAVAVGVQAVRQRMDTVQKTLAHGSLSSLLIYISVWSDDAETFPDPEFRVHMFQNGPFRECSDARVRGTARTHLQEKIACIYSSPPPCRSMAVRVVSSNHLQPHRNIVHQPSLYDLSHCVTGTRTRLHSRARDRNRKNVIHVALAW
jgi:hypothetical protein